MNLHTLSIGQFRRNGIRSGFCYRDSLIVTDRVEDLERFQSPCRIDAITVLVCISGEADCSINLRHYHISGDMLLVNFPENVIQIHHTENLEAYAVLISSDFLSDLSIDFKQRTDFYIDMRKNAACPVRHDDILMLKPYYSLLCDNISMAQTETHEIIKGLVSAFSYTVISLMRQRQENSDDDTQQFTRNKQLFNKFMELVKVHHAFHRGVRFYADRLCLTPNYLSGVIKEYTGKTVTEWVNDYVILEAKILLRDSEMSIQEIAFKLHFPTQSAFGKYFKQKVGVGPKLYRSGGE